jgi:hypothetical protein
LPQACLEPANGGRENTMRVFYTAAAIALLAAPVHAQTQSVPRYGETSKAKSPQEIQAEKEADKAYHRSLGNIPDQGPTDPWGNVRTEGSPKAIAKTSAMKRTKTTTPAN